MICENLPCNFLCHNVLDACFCSNNALLHSHLRAVQFSRRPLLRASEPLSRFEFLSATILSLLLLSVERNAACLMYVERYKKYLKVRHL